MTESQADRKQISYGYLLSKENFENTPLIPPAAKRILKKGEYYLLIFIPGEELLKISSIPVEHSDIKKILIRLKEFSPDLVKGISDILKNYNLGDSTIHTTGLCFSGINCFYETYVDATKATTLKISLEGIKNEFKKIPRVEDVQVLEIELKDLK